jgi:hypothetical protein
MPYLRAGRDLLRFAPQQRAEEEMSTPPKADHEGSKAVNGDSLEFGCPICRKTSTYERTRELLRPDGTVHPYPIFRCLGCDFHFLDPAVYPISGGKPN